MLILFFLAFFLFFFADTGAVPYLHCTTPRKELSRGTTIQTWALFKWRTYNTYWSQFAFFLFFCLLKYAWFFYFILFFNFYFRGRPNDWKTSRWQVSKKEFYRQQLPANHHIRKAPTYFPFWQGRHMCIGQHLALLESRVVLATLLKHLDFTLKPGTYFVSCFPRSPCTVSRFPFPVSRFSPLASRLSSLVSRFSFLISRFSVSRFSFLVSYVFVSLSNFRGFINPHLTVRRIQNTAGSGANSISCWRIMDDRLWKKRIHNRRTYFRLVFSFCFLEFIYTL